METELKPSYKIVWSEEDNAYIATTTEFKSLSGIGHTPFVAFAELYYAIDEGRRIVSESEE